jgi:hypothetical protein
MQLAQQARCVGKVDDVVVDRLPEAPTTRIKLAFSSFPCHPSSFLFLTHLLPHHSPWPLRVTDTTKFEARAAYAQENLSLDQVRLVSGIPERPLQSEAL